MYKLITFSKYSDELSIGFERNPDRKRDELTANKSVKSKYYLRIMLKDVFGFAESQEKATYGLGYKLTLKRNRDVAVIDKSGGIADMLEIKMIISIGTYLIIHLPFNIKLFYQIKF